MNRAESPPRMGFFRSWVVGAIAIASVTLATSLGAFISIVFSLTTDSPCIGDDNPACNPADPQPHLLRDGIVSSIVLLVCLVVLIVVLRATIRRAIRPVLGDEHLERWRLVVLIGIIVAQPLVLIALIPTVDVLHDHWELGALGVTGAVLLVWSDLLRRWVGSRASTRQANRSSS